MLIKYYMISKCISDGWSMIQKVPVGGFKWHLKPMTLEDILKYDVEGSKGCFLEVSLEVPEELHSKFNCYPLAPEHLKITDEMISPTTANIREKRGHPAHFASTKLAPNLLPKEKYKVHIRNLQFMLRQGLTLVDVHRVLEFTQVC